MKPNHNSQVTGHALVCGFHCDDGGVLAPVVAIQRSRRKVVKTLSPDRSGNQHFSLLSVLVSAVLSRSQGQNSVSTSIYRPKFRSRSVSRPKY